MTGYILITVAVVLVLTGLSAAGSPSVTSHAWGHAVVVSGFALLLPLRLRAARRGSRRALLAVGLIAGVLLVVNVVEALVPGFLPVWMRIEMVGVAGLMAALAAGVARSARIVR